MNKLMVLLLVITMSTILAVKTDSNPIQAVLTGLALVGKIEQFYPKDTKNEEKNKKKDSKKLGE